MEQHEKRRAPRITCSIGLHLQGEWTMVRAQVEDIGRLGARLRLTLRELGLEPHAGMVEAAAQFRRLLSNDVVAHFCPELLGSLVQRRVDAVRISEAEAEHPFVDVGCRFDRPLTELDAAALGLPIPMEGESLEDANAGAAGKEPQKRPIEGTECATGDKSAYTDLRFSLLVQKSDLGTEPDDSRDA